VLVVLCVFLIPHRRIDHMAQDWRFRHFGAPHISSLITLITIDQDSIDFFTESYGMSWPWYRQVYAPVVQYLNQTGARAVIFDMLFSEPSVFGVNDDQTFVEAIAANPRVVLARTQQVAPIPQFAENAATGVVNAIIDEDGLIRKTHLLPEGNPCLAFAALDVAGLPRPSLPDPLELCYYRAPASGKVFHEIPFAGIVQDYANIQTGRAPELDPAFFKDRFIFIAPKAPGLYDLKPTPVNPQAAGVEIHATLLENMLLDDYLRYFPVWARVFVIFGLTYLGIWSSLWRESRRGFLSMLAIAAISIGACLVIPPSVIMPVVDITFALGLALIATQTVNYSTEGRRKRQIKRMFTHYLDADLVNQLIDEPGLLKLGGEKRELTIFFSDLAGFSTFSEKMDSESLVGFLNQYLSVMTRVLLEERAYVDKYEGDAIMAFWGAPVPMEQHALFACRAALANQQEMIKLNEEFAKQGLPSLKVRIGLNTGWVVAGNMGADLGHVKKLSYTVMGDAVNMAARLEGINKEYDTLVMIGSRTRELVQAHMACRHVDTVRVKGKSNPEAIYELMGEKGMVPETVAALIREYEHAGEIYRKARFLDALDLFREIIDKYPHDGPATRMMKRCEHFLKHPPPDDWDGVHNMTSK